MSVSDIQRLEQAEFEQQTDDYDSLVARMPFIDPYCSRSFWILAAHQAFHRDSDLMLLRGDQFYACFARTLSPAWGRMLLPLEASWCLASPLVCDNFPTMLRDLLPYLHKNQDWDSALVTGLEPEARETSMLVHALAMGFQVYQGMTTVRMLGDLRKGLDAYLERRERRFRQTIRRALKRCAQEGIVFVREADNPLALLARAMDVEARSWKGESGVGVNEGEMRHFYELLCSMQGPQGHLRWTFARLDDRDVGFILGGVVDGTYRGYQFSFDNKYRALSLGHALQFQTIADLCEEGVSWYDLGTEMDYKRRWTDRNLTTTSFLFKR